MKKHIGSKLALYPTTLVVVGTMVNGKPNWTLVGHLGIIGHDRILVSLAKPHYINQGIKETKALTVSIVDESMLKKADYVGCSSGNKTVKSAVFAYHTLKPVLFEMPTYEYLRTGDIIGKCMSFGKEFRPDRSGPAGDHTRNALF